MGDSSRVIIAREPAMAAIVHATLFVTGLVTGYLVDAALHSAGAAAHPRADPATSPVPPRPLPATRQAGRGGAARWDGPTDPPGTRGRSPWRP